MTNDPENDQPEPEDETVGNTKPTKPTDTDVDQGDETDEGERAKSPVGDNGETAAKEEYPGPSEDAT